MIEPRPINEIAAEIRREWKKPYFGAVPYLHAMSSLVSVDDYYGADSGHSVVTYFLLNASTFRGESARNIKKELKALTGGFS